MAQPLPACLGTRPMGCNSFPVRTLINLTQVVPEARHLERIELAEFQSNSWLIQLIRHTEGAGSHPEGRCHGMHRSPCSASVGWGKLIW